MSLEFFQHIDLAGALTILESTGYIDLNKQELRNAVVQNLASEPGTPSGGQIIFNTSKLDNYQGQGKFGYRTATAWVYPDMQKSTYDANDNGKIDLAENSEKLDSQAGSYYLNRTNHSGQQAASTILDFALEVRNTIAAHVANTNSVNMTLDATSLRADVKVAASGGIEIISTGIQLTNTGVGAGTYTKLTVDAKGRVTSATTLASGDLPSHTHTASNITDFNTAVRVNRLDQMAVPTSNVSMNNQKIINVANPTNDNDAANKLYVDTLRQGLKAKQSVYVASTANVTLSSSRTIDGKTVGAGRRVLIKDQTTASQNGIYLSSATAWTRVDDADAWDKLVSAYCWVEEGTVNGDTGWYCPVDAGGTLGTTAISWVQFTGGGAITAGSGLLKSGNTLSVDVDNQSIEIASNKVQVKLNTNAGLVKDANGLQLNVETTQFLLSGNMLYLQPAVTRRKFATNFFSNAVDTEYTVTHALGTNDVFVELFRNSAPRNTVFVRVERPSTSTVKLIFAQPPGSINWRIIVGT